jgi:hypothetical protein
VVLVGEQREPEAVLGVDFFCFVGASGLMPMIAVSPTSPRTSRSPHACVVQPGVSAFG